MATNKITKAVEETAEKAEQALSKDFSQGYQGLLEETGKKSEQVAKGAVEDEAQNTKGIVKAGERPSESLPAPRPAEGTDPARGAKPTVVGDTSPAAVHTPPDGPPWPARDDIPGAARGKTLNPPNKRHTVSGVKSGQVKGDNSLILKGYEQSVHEDIAGIAAGNAEWDPVSQRYSINGRSYGIEPTGTVFPVEGDGIINLGRNQYAALQHLIKAGGDPAAVPAFSRSPQFLKDPESVETALDLYRRMFS